MAQLTNDEKLKQICSFRGPTPPQGQSTPYLDDFESHKGALVEEFVLRNCPKLKRHRVVYVSVGGAKGQELEYAFKKGYGFGILFEYDPSGVQEAEKRFSQQIGEGRCKVYPRDLANNLGEADRWIHEDIKPEGVLISAQSVLHELPDRANAKQYSLGHLLSISDGVRIRIFHSREPVRPRYDSSWHNRVSVMIPNAKSALVAAAAEAIRDRFSVKFSAAPTSFYGPVLPTGNGFAEMPGLVAIELLHKFLRFRDLKRLQHEMGECLVAADAYSWAGTVQSVFGLNHVLHPVYGVSDGFATAYHDEGVAVYLQESWRPIDRPECFATIAAAALPSSKYMVLRVGVESKRRRADMEEVVKREDCAMEHICIRSEISDHVYKIAASAGKKTFDILHVFGGVASGGRIGCPRLCFQKNGKNRVSLSLKEIAGVLKEMAVVPRLVVLDVPCIGNEGALDEFLKETYVDALLYYKASKPDASEADIFLAEFYQGILEGRPFKGVCDELKKRGTGGSLSPDVRCNPNITKKGCKADEFTMHYPKR